MNTPELIETWNEKRDKFKLKFVFLTDNDLRYNEDKIEEMFEDLRIKLGKTKQELLKIIAAL